MTLARDRERPSPAHGDAGDLPLEAAEMASLMAALGPMEPAPRLAAAVSGGADSMALAVLLKDWAEARGGAVVTLGVDHGLRPGSAAEAGRVAATLRALGFEHHVLAWRGPKPRANLQDAARRARYALLSAWCARHGVLHLATGHHRGDQAETLLLRLGRGSGLDGLAGMPAVRETADLRLLRPLLPVPKARLRATLRARGLPWVEDPSNRNPAFSRSRWRQVLPQLEALGLTPDRLAATAGHLAAARAALERAVAGLLARAAWLEPAGHAWLAPEPLAAAETETGQRALARLLMAVGGAAYAPRHERLARLHGRLVAGLETGATLGGCRVLPRRGRLLFVREPSAVAALAVRPGQRLHWDGRFEVVLARGPAAHGELVLGPLGPAGWAEVAGGGALDRLGALPAAARGALPALRDRKGVVAVPPLGYRRDPRAVVVKSCRFAPTNPLTAACFTVA